MKEKKAEFQFIGYKILKSLIEISEVHTKFEDLDFGLDVSGVYHRSTGDFKLFLRIRIKNEENGFLCEVAALGDYMLSNIESDKVLENYLFINAPALLFPYVRAYVSTVTTLSGIDSVVMPTMNLSRIVIEDFKDQIKIID